MNRFLKMFALLACAALLMALAGCSGEKKDDGEKAAKKAETPAQKKAFRVGFVYVSPIGDADGCKLSL